jgi:starch synthase
MNLLFTASECSPYAKTGGLGDVLGSLPATLRARGHSASCAIPLYRGLLEKLPDAEPTTLELSIPLGGALISGRVWKARADSGLPLFLIQQDEFFDRTNLYGSPFDYPDNASRFIFFSKAVVELARHLNPLPQIIHCNDWQTGLIPAFVKALGLPFKTVYSIHNLAFQGIFPKDDFGLTNLPQRYFTPSTLEFYGSLNSMKAGITLADQITTVSPRYAEEIQTESFGCGLDGVLRVHQAKLTGILNGVDGHFWDPETDPALRAPFHSESLKGKAACKDALLAEFGLDPGQRDPVFGAITRLTGQKGVDLMESILEGLLAQGARFILLGSGEARFESFFRTLAARYPTQVGVRIGFDEALSHRIVAGSDFFLMPSLFEPCGLTQLYSLRYGTIPIVHRTGGLADSVEDYDAETGEGTGFVFNSYSPVAFTEACRRALALYRNKPALQAMRRQGMAKEFTWDQSAVGYEAVYERVLA